MPRTTSFSGFHEWKSRSRDLDGVQRVSGQEQASSGDSSGHEVLQRGNSSSVFHHPHSLPAWPEATAGHGLLLPAAIYRAVPPSRLPARLCVRACLISKSTTWRKQRHRVVTRGRWGQTMLLVKSCSCCLFFILIEGLHFNVFVLWKFNIFF